MRTGTVLIIAGMVLLMMPVVYFVRGEILPPEELREPFSVAVLTNEPVSYFYNVGYLQASISEGNFLVQNWTNDDVYVNGILISPQQEETLFVDNTKPIEYVIQTKDFGNITKYINGSKYNYLDISTISLDPAYQSYASAIAHLDTSFENGYLMASMPANLRLVDNVLVIENENIIRLLEFNLTKTGNTGTVYLAIAGQGANAGCIINDFKIVIPEDEGEFYFMADVRDNENNYRLIISASTNENVKLNVAKQYIDKKLVYGMSENGNLDLSSVDLTDEREGYYAMWKMIVPFNCMFAGAVKVSITRAEIILSPIMIGCIISGLMLIISGVFVERKKILIGGR